MKTIQFFAVLILLVAFMPVSTYTQCYMDIPKEDLSDKEIQSLKKMREEEMLAHDVYLAFSEIYSRPVFPLRKGVMSGAVSSMGYSFVRLGLGMMDLYRCAYPGPSMIIAYAPCSGKRKGWQYGTIEFRRTWTCIDFAYN